MAVCERGLKMSPKQTSTGIPKQLRGADYDGITLYRKLIWSYGAKKGPIAPN